MCGMERNRGTNYGYNYSSCVIAQSKLIEGVRKYVEIKMVLLDGEFFNEPCIKKLEPLNLKYLMPAKKNRKKFLQSLRPPCKTEVPLGSMYVLVIAL